MAKGPLSGTEADQPANLDELPSKRALVVLARGFEDTEAACALDALGWTKYRPSIATVEVDIAGFAPEIEGAFGTRYTADVLIDDVDEDLYDALVIPGGFHNRGYDEVYDERVASIVRELRKRSAPIATMCVGILPVADAGVLAGGRATTYRFSSRHDNAGRLSENGCKVVDESVVEWNGIISCSGPSRSEDVMARLLELLVGKDAASEVARFRLGC